MREFVRYAGFLVLIGAAFGAWIGLAPKADTRSPDVPTGSAYESEISKALAAEAKTSLLSQSALQQQVANGWVARDLLAIIAEENVDILNSQGAVVDATGSRLGEPFDERLPALLLVGVLAICWIGLTAPRQPRPAAPPLAANRLPEAGGAGDDEAGTPAD
jgi:hypothetical protein